MDIIQFIAQFFYRIRYWLLWGGFIVTALVAYFTQFLPFSYTVNSNIYAGVTNVTNIDGSKIENISIAICSDCGISYFLMIRMQRYCFSLIKEEKFSFFFCRYDRYLLLLLTMAMMDTTL